MSKQICIASGDGIGPEIMQATLRILEAAAAPVSFLPIETGEKVYLEGHSSGIRPESWDHLKRTKILLKAPITTPQGGGYKSLNVTLRKTLGLYANVRPVRAFSPYVKTHYPQMDMVIIRENEEDTYAGIEHRQTQEVYQCLKLISRPGCERIVRYAFEYARAHKRRKVTAMVKDNIMKITDGIFHTVFREVAAEYPDLEHASQIIDIGAAHIAERPQNFDVIVTLNLYGDIISDIAAQVAGSVGMAGSANIGEHISMFEAIHGSAPDIAGRDLANPSGLLQAAVMMLVHIGAGESATLIQNAWLRTLEDGIHTGDIYQPGISQEKTGTAGFGSAIIERLGKNPEKFPAADFRSAKAVQVQLSPRKSVPKTLVGSDFFVELRPESVNAMGVELNELAGKEGLKLKLITNRGVKVYPDGNPETFCTDHWRCRFVSVNSDADPMNPVYAGVERNQILGLYSRLSGAGWDIIKTENLYLFDGERGFSLGQGE